MQVSQSQQSSRPIIYNPFACSPYRPSNTQANTPSNTYTSYTPFAPSTSYIVYTPNPSSQYTPVSTSSLPSNHLSTYNYYNPF